MCLMEVRQRVFSAALFLLLVLHCVTSINITNDNPFDLGEANACVQPQGLSVCTIDYEVPAAIAHHRFATIKEGLVNHSISLVTGLENLPCRTAIAEVQCARHFPRCHSSEGRVSVAYSQDACLQVIDNCTDTVEEQGSCDFTVNASSHGMCKTVSEFVSESGRPLLACNKTASSNPLWYVTEWMFAYLRDIDEDDLSSVSALLSPSCFEQYSRFRCQSIGRCWDQGRRIEFSSHNTRKNCQAIVGWYVLQKSH